MLAYNPNNLTDVHLFGHITSVLASGALCTDEEALSNMAARITTFCDTLADYERLPQDVRLQDIFVSDKTLHQQWSRLFDNSALSTHEHAGAPTAASPVITDSASLTTAPAAAKAPVSGLKRRRPNLEHTSSEAAAAC